MYTHPLKNSGLCTCLLMHLGKMTKRWQVPEHSISFKLLGHVASVHFVRKYLLDYHYQ